MCLSEGIGIIYNPLAGGILTGRYLTGQQVKAKSRFALSGVLKAGDYRFTLPRRPQDR